MFKGRSVDERLKAGAGLATGLNSAVEDTAAIVHATDHGAHRAVRRQGDHGPLIGSSRTALRAHDLAQNLSADGLKVGVKGQSDHQVGGIGTHPAQHLGGGEVQRVTHIAVIGQGYGREFGRGGQGGLFLIGTDPAFGTHVFQDEALTFQCQGHIAMQGQPSRRLGQGGQQGGFRQGQLARRLAEIGARRPIDAKGIGPEIGAVEVEL